jgi:1,2-phenylacetyl-CoA epoxidase PaaB subunit
MNNVANDQQALELARTVLMRRRAWMSIVIETHNGEEFDGLTDLCPPSLQEEIGGILEPEERATFMNMPRLN